MFCIVAPIDLTEKPIGVVVSNAKNCSKRGKEMQEAGRKMTENMLSTLRLQSGRVDLDNTRVCSDQFFKFYNLTVAYS